ncbi:MAG: threonine--tRNA ligase [Spirochaetia bacterium]|nr:threonine--tRNA ligase [Spirochaetia bacterium]
MSKAGNLEGAEASEKSGSGKAPKVKTKFPVSTMRHSAAHVLAQALRQRYGTVQLAIGPDTESGFFYDVIVDPPVKAEDLPDLERRMKKIGKLAQKFVRFELPIDEAIEKLAKEDQPFKVEMAKDLKSKGETVLSFYKNVGGGKDEAAFIDMCAGPHVEKTNELGAFKLVSVSGAYWRGDATGPQLQRISGILFESDEELKAYEYMVEEAKRRDHRRLGTDLELFTTSEQIGPGLILWLPRGTVVRDQLEDWARETEERNGYVRVSTPVITKESLFYTSEHLPHYKESMFPPIQMDNENYYIKPMNCPFHHTIFSMRPRSYRELPLRLAEYGTCHRYEDSGALFGLMRVRAMTMNDAHIYCTEDQAVEEFVSVMKLHEYYYKILGIKEYWMELSLRNPANDKYHGDESMWKRAEELTRRAMDVSGIQYKVENDGAAFYGPKLDFQIKSSIGRTFTVSTCQLDLFMPQKFDLKYVDKDGATKRPACIHRSPLGTHERFVGFLIEHFAGAFPLWLAPEQVRILPVGEDHQEYARKLEQSLRNERIRTHVDDSAETLGKRIRNAEKMKIPYMLVVGDKEMESGRLNARNYFTGEQREWESAAFVAALKEDIASKRIQEIVKKGQA